ncbi:hypothetical protein OIE66_30660 [Nonomuraea sp. NBC_01738]|uniref:hypothetical protein n=1 Tax=Nonomuraea sp. NBC_01738 TaxID=2976003 RepID=UPI002E14625C|nr:hypothetical protein OIE66_30660 [Nonomuraea sp. NBC_01738]
MAGEQVWTVAWWRGGWGVWPGEEPDLTSAPSYDTANITQASSQAATHWALGVVPPHPRTRVRCPFGGDPQGAARLLASVGRSAWWRR